MALNTALTESETRDALSRETTQSSDGSWRVAGELTSKNAFGVKVKFRYQVTLMRQENGDWREIETALAESE